MAVPESYAYNGFGGGLNTLKSARDIADNELVEATNVEIVGQTGIRSRGGLTSLATGLNGNVSSIFHYRASGGTECVIFTAGSKIYRMPVGGGSVTDVTGGLTLPSTETWQWAVLNDKAIGVNRGTGSNANPVVLDSPSDTAAAALTGTPPKALYVEVFDSRLWLVSATEPNRLWYSALGNPEDYTTSGIAGAGSILVGGNEGDNITGIRAFQGNLYIFKRTRIYVLVPGSPSTDTRQWNVPMLTDRIGCIAGYTIQAVLGDLIFLSDDGVVALSSVERAADSSKDTLSERVPEIRQINKNVVGMPSVVNPEGLQYWVAVAESGSSSPSVTWVLDYTGIARREVAWTKFKGAVVGTAYGLVYESGRPRVYVGYGTAIYRYGDDGVYDDAGTPYEKIVLTKALSPGPQLWRKEFFRYGIEFEIETDDVELLVSYILDEDEARLKTVTVTFGAAVGGSRWDEALWDVGTWASESTRSVDFLSRIAGTVGRRAQVIQFRLYNNNADAFQLKRLTLDAALLTRAFVGDVTL